MLKKFNSPVVALLASAVLWGIGGPIIKFTLNFVTPSVFLVIRFLIASLLLYFFVPWKKHNYLKHLGKKGFTKLFLLGFLGSSVNLGLYFLAQSQTSSIEGTVIYSMGPIFVFLGGIIFLKEPVTKKELIGFVVTLLGFIIIIINPILGKSAADVDKHLIGNFIMLLSAISWGSYAVLTKYFFINDKKENITSPVFLTFITSFAGAVTLLPFAIYEIFNAKIDYIMAMPGILYMAIFSSVIAFFFYSFGIKKIEVSHVSFFEYLVPAITLPLAIIFLGEKFSYWYLVGFVLLALGLYITQRVPKHIEHLKSTHRSYRKQIAKGK